MEEPVVEVRADGPYVVRGPLELRRMRDVQTSHGEPVAWAVRSRERLAGGRDALVCRCGRSEAMPFCDESRCAEGGWDGTESAPSGVFADRAQATEGRGLTIRYDKQLCCHAGFCGTDTTNVWKMVRELAPDDTVTRAYVMAMIDRCPSGALTYRFDDLDDDLDADLPVGVGVVDGGPLFVTGRVEVRSADGVPYERRNRVALCRCGTSERKPFCDGSHVRAGFRDGCDDSRP